MGIEWVGEGVTLGGLDGRDPAAVALRVRPWGKRGVFARNRTWVSGWDGRWIAKARLFTGASKPAVARALKLGRWRRAGWGKLVGFRGPCEWMGLVTAGLGFELGEGDRILRVVEPGDCFGWLPWTGKSARVIANSGMEFVCWPAADMRRGLLPILGEGVLRECGADAAARAWCAGLRDHRHRGLKVYEWMRGWCVPDPDGGPWAAWAGLPWDWVVVRMTGLRESDRLRHEIQFRVRWVRKGRHTLWMAPDNVVALASTEMI